MRKIALFIITLVMLPLLGCATNIKASGSLDTDIAAAEVLFTPVSKPLGQPPAPATPVKKVYVNPPEPGEFPFLLVDNGEKATHVVRLGIDCQTPESSCEYKVRGQPMVLGGSGALAIDDDPVVGPDGKTKADVTVYASDKDRPNVIYMICDIPVDAPLGRPVRGFSVVGDHMGVLYRAKFPSQGGDICPSDGKRISRR